MSRCCLCLVLLLCAGALWADELIPERWPNGMRLIVKPMTASGVVSAELLIDYSALDESPRLQGIRQVLVAGMLQGSDARSGDDIRRALDAVGGTLEGRVHLEMLEFTITVPAGALPAGLDALAEVVLRPALTDEIIDVARQRTRRLQEREAAGAMDAADLIANQLIFRGHPYMHGGLGTPETLNEITPEAVREAYRRFVAPGNTVIAVAGRCTPDAARAQARTRFGTWTNASRRLRLDLGVPAIAESRLVLRELPVRNTCVMLAFPVVGAEHADFLVLRLIDTLLSGGTASRLFRSVREEKRLAYDTATVFPVQASGSRFAVYAVTRSTEMEKTKVALQEELARLQTEPVPAPELQRAKTSLKSRYLLSHQFSAQYAFDLAWYELLGQGAAYDRALPAKIDAITPADIQRVARSAFTHYYLIVIMPEMRLTP